jgi:hypothetical protein
LKQLWWFTTVPRMPRQLTEVCLCHGQRTTCCSSRPAASHVGCNLRWKPQSNDSLQVEVAGIPVWAWTLAWFLGGIVLGFLSALSCCLCWRAKASSSAKAPAYATSPQFPRSIRQVGTHTAWFDITNAALQLIADILALLQTARGKLDCSGSLSTSGAGTSST